MPSNWKQLRICLSGLLQDCAYFLFDLLMLRPALSAEGKENMEEWVFVNVDVTEILRGLLNWPAYVFLGPVRVATQNGIFQTLETPRGCGCPS